MSEWEEILCDQCSGFNSFLRFFEIHSLNDWYIPAAWSCSCECFENSSRKFQWHIGNISCSKVGICSYQSSSWKSRWSPIRKKLTTLSRVNMTEDWYSNVSCVCGLDSGIKPEEVEEVYMGNVLQANIGQAREQNQSKRSHELEKNYE